VISLPVLKVDNTLPVYIAHAQLDPRLYRVQQDFDQNACQERLEGLAAENSEWWVAYSGEAAVGWVVLTHNQLADPSAALFLSDLYVHVAWRSHGIGTALLQHTEQLAVAHGCNTIGLSVNPTLNPRAHSLYLRLGYVHDGLPPYLERVDDGENEWLIGLEKKLEC
jgi:GNAT superfamily N-acetyltransferase